MALAVSDGELRRQLKSLGYSAGPITDSTRSLYVKKLNQLQSERQQRERSSRRPRTIGQRKEADTSAATHPRQARLRPSAASSGAWRLEDDQDDEEPDEEPEADYAGSSADGRRTGKWESVGGESPRGTVSSKLYSETSRRLRSDQYPAKTEGLFSDRSAENTGSLLSGGKAGSTFSDRYEGSTDSHLTDRYAGNTSSTFSDRYKGSTDSLLTDRYAGNTSSTFSDRYKGSTDSLLTDRYAGNTGSTFSDRYKGSTDSLLTDRYAGNTSSTFSDRYKGSTDSLLTDRYAGNTGSTFSDRYKGSTDSLLTDRYAGNTGSTFSDRYKGSTDSLLTDRYAGNTGSTFSDRYKGSTDSLLTDRYAGNTGSPFSDQDEVKTGVTSSDRHAEKIGSLYSRRYMGITDSVNLDSCTGKYQGASSQPYARKSTSLFSDAYTGKFGDKSARNVQGSYSDTQYRGWSDIWSEKDDESHLHRTSGSVKKNQKHKNRLFKIEFYLAPFLYIATIVLCLVLLALVCVKALRLVESQENTEENIKMLPMDCHGKTDTFCRNEEHKMIMIILTEMYEYLAEIAGEFECGSESTLKSKCVPIVDVKVHLSILNVPNINKFNEALQWIMQSSLDLGIRLVGEDSEATVTSVDQVTCLESTRPHMNLYCRLQCAFFTILRRMLIFITILGLLWIALLLLKYYSRKMEEQEHDMNEMVNKIIAVTRAHYRDWAKDLELVPYVPIPHVRDTLIQPKDRKKMNKIWEKAVQFLEANESRIRTEKQRINGQDFLVWRWTQPSSLCDSM
ncbi:inner nuclear membrane protein Man1-like [Narcine bancroftii]|uniref:inner nuclear membrane protein Man1-like n=1 Tax=Narcine bancroftii TaxID=1343680 RepID=UPI0038321361